MSKELGNRASSLTTQKAIRFVVLMGLVSLFADMTYEGARSITGPYLAFLGASATVVGIIAGLGELIGYALRLVSGYFSDKTGKYWLLTGIGYALNLLSVPLLAFAQTWPAAAGLIILERFGKAIRSPSKDAMLSYATHATGRGWGFGLHEAMDQIGAVLGPLLISWILFIQGSYAWGFEWLLIPALLSLLLLAAARFFFPRPQELEVAHPSLDSSDFRKSYWLYLSAICLLAAGYVDFPLIAYHFQKQAIVSSSWIPLFYAAAMGIGGLSAFLFGHLFDRYGISILIGTTLLSLLFPPLVFLGGFAFSLLGMLIWGIGLGAQESIMRAIIAHLVSSQQRATAYGIFNIWFGVAWFLGSALMGMLYDFHLPLLIGFSISMQLAAALVFLFIKRNGGLT
ncbi:MFS transporter [Candidatus Protochlamydia phocaeensis]|uniref:MFS transporter n=1 Tax=Candidatus Protochlamydia phocaeensis TaxID=1414722 RepID=UPI00083893AC|nr:MFS transporter [Candidatus Protochlamydia phocaeensis]